MRSVTITFSENSFNVLWRALHDREHKLQKIIHDHDEESDEAVVANNDIIYLRTVKESLERQAKEAGLRIQASNSARRFWIWPRCSTIPSRLHQGSRP